MGQGRHSRRLGRALTVLAGTLWMAAAQAGGLLLWEVQGGRAPLWLFGSIHLCRAECLPLPAAVEARFLQAQVLAVELDPLNADMSSVLTGGDTVEPGRLRRQLGPADWRTLDRTLAAQGIPDAVAERLTPAMATLLVSLGVADQIGLSPRYGTDLHLLLRARDGGKPVIELESMARQLEALNAGTPQEQLAALRATLRSVEDGSLRASLEELVAAWLAGDAARVGAAMRQAEASDPSMATMFRELFDRRNREMADSIARLADSGKPTLVVVGAGHLAGRDAIPDLLARRGYRVRQLHKGD